MPDVTVSEERLRSLKLTMYRLTWTCCDCGNVYETQTKDCPNRLLDELAFAELIDPDDLRSRDGSEIITDPVKTVADALFKRWFPHTTIEQMKRQNSYNGEYEIAVEDALAAVTALGIRKT